MAHTPESLRADFEKWKSKKDARLLKLYQAMAGTENTAELQAKIKAMETEIEQKQAKLERALAREYERLYKTGASSSAKKERQERTHKLCTMGAFIEKAGLGDLDKKALLGLLVQQATYLKNNPHMLEKWAAEGERILQIERVHNGI